MKPQELEKLESEHNDNVSELQKLGSWMLSILNKYPQNKWVEIQTSLIASALENLKHHYMYMLKNVVEERDLDGLTNWDSDEIEGIKRMYMSGECTYKMAEMLIKSLNDKYDKESGRQNCH